MRRSLSACLYLWNNSIFWNLGLKATFQVASNTRLLRGMTDMLSSAHGVPDPGPGAVGTVEGKMAPASEGAGKTSCDHWRGRPLRGREDGGGGERLAGRRNSRKIKELKTVLNPAEPWGPM